MRTNLAKQAGKIDTLDAIIGTTAALCIWSGSDFLYDVGVTANLIELATLKLPFIAKYVSQTKDTKAALYWGVKEIVTNTSPLGSLMDIIPAYKMRTDYMLSKNNL